MAAFEAALDAEVRTRLTALVDGILAYRRHPYRRPEASREVVWQEGTTRLLRCGAAGGRPVLIVPSLVNRYHILDFVPGRSFADFLGQAGFTPFVVDWREPGSVERGFSLADYVAGRLDRALEAALDLAGARPALVGYCMGGLLALALAQRRARDVAALALLATPWDFRAGAGSLPALLAASRPALAAAIDSTGALPTDIIQAMFFARDPLLAARKFVRFARMAMDSPEAAAFVALEDWINDGVPLAGPVARETLFGWYCDNAPGRGAWQIEGRPVEPGKITLPCLTLIPERDRIVPPASASALSAALPDAVERRTPLGHIGMMASGRAREQAWTVLVDWLNERTS